MVVDICETERLEVSHSQFNIPPNQIKHGQIYAFTIDTLKGRHMYHIVNVHDVSSHINLFSFFTI